MGSTLTTAIPGATQRFQGKETPRMKYGNLEKHVNQKLCVRNRTTTLKPCSREGKEQPARKKLALLNWSRPRSCAFAPVADVLSLNLAPKQPCSPCVARQERNPLLNEYGATTGAYSPGLGKEELLIRLDANSNFETCRCPQAASPIHVSFAEIAYIDQSDSSSESATSKDPLLAEAHVGTSLSSCHCRPRENPPSRHGPNSKGRFGRPAAALPRSTPHSMYDLCSDGNGYSESKVTTGTQTTKLTKIGRNKKSRSFPRSIGVDCPHPSVQASTSQLLRCFGIYLYRKCRLLKRFSPQDLAVWLQRVDHTLLVQGWQDFTFINPANLIFMFMLTREAVAPTLSSESELQRIVLTCFYLSYAYMGNEISYPLKPFLIDADREKFWSRCLTLIDKYSGNMLKINSCPAFFGEMILELTTYGSDFD